MANLLDVRVLVQPDIVIEAAPNPGDPPPPQLTSVVVFDTGVIDLTRTVRIESLAARAVYDPAEFPGGVGDPSFDVEWIGGMREEVELGVFQQWGQNTPIINDSASMFSSHPQGLHIMGLPNFISPYVRFRMTARIGSPNGSRFELYAYVKQQSPT